MGRRNANIESQKSRTSERKPKPQRPFSPSRSPNNKSRPDIAAACNQPNVVSEKKPPKKNKKLKTVNNKRMAKTELNSPLTRNDNSALESILSTSSTPKNPSKSANISPDSPITSNQAEGAMSVLSLINASSAPTLVATNTNSNESTDHDLQLVNMRTLVDSTRECSFETPLKPKTPKASNISLKADAPSKHSDDLFELNSNQPIEEVIAIGHYPSFVIDGVRQATSKEIEQQMVCNVQNIGTIKIKPKENYQTLDQYNVDLMKSLGLFPSQNVIYQQWKLDDNGQQSILQFGILTASSLNMDNVLKFIPYFPKKVVVKDGKVMKRSFGFHSLTEDDKDSNMIHDWPKWANGYYYRNSNEKDLSKYTVKSIDNGLYVASYRINWFITNGLNNDRDFHKDLSLNLARMALSTHEFIEREYFEIVNLIGKVIAEDKTTMAEDTIKKKIAQDTVKMTNAERLRTKGYENIQVRGFTIQERLAMKLEQRFTETRTMRNTEKGILNSAKVPTLSTKDQVELAKPVNISTKRIRRTDGFSGKMRYGEVSVVPIDNSEPEAMSTNFIIIHPPVNEFYEEGQEDNTINCDPNHNQQQSGNNLNSSEKDANSKTPSKKEQIFNGPDVDDLESEFDNNESDDELEISTEFMKSVLSSNKVMRALKQMAKTNKKQKK